MKLIPTINRLKIDLNDKNLRTPTFFLISNLGGGGSDKYREVVYLDLYKKIPILYNYFYLKMNPYGFASTWLKNMPQYDNFADFVNYTRNSMIKDKEYFSSFHKFKYHNSNDSILLLDSGASNIINSYLKDIDYKKNKRRFLQLLKKDMFDYYKFAHRMKFDIVIAFDIGGKYTFKGDERSNKQIISGNLTIKNNAQDINKYFLIKTLEYLKDKQFHPKIFAPVHGNSPTEYARNTKTILEIEKEYNYKFDGFALGGIASSIGTNINDWGITSEIKQIIKNINKTDIGSTEIHNAIIASYAGRIVRNIIGEKRPIHALGAGGKLNIIPLYFSGVNSFDTQTPGRRAYDGNSLSSKKVYNSNFNGSISKYLIGLLDSNFNLVNNNQSEMNYIKLNKLHNKIEQCDCPSCLTKSISEIKKLYNNKEESNEDYYYARQLINSHGIWQHVYLSNFIGSCNNFEEFLYNFKESSEVSDLINYIVNGFNYII